jgi:hypothetical protein
VTWRRSLCLALLAALALGACGGDDDESSDPPEDTTDTTSSPATTATDEEPPGTDPEAVEPYVQDLLTRYDEVTSQIVADPAIAADPNHELYAQLRELVTPDSQMIEPVVNALVHRGEQGVSQRPYNEGELPIARYVDGDVTATGPDEVTFPTCTLFDYRLFDSLDRETEYHTDIQQVGTGTAARIDGEWRISRLEGGTEESTQCQEPR